MDSKLSLKLKQYRNIRRITQEEAAEEFGISSVYYGEIERGERLPSAEKLILICSILERNGLCPYSCRDDMHDSFSEKLCEIIRVLSDNQELIEPVYKVVMALHPGSRKDPGSR